MNKTNSQIFFFDLIFSFVILLVSLGLLFTYFLVIEDNEDIHSLNRQILDRFTTTNINSLNNENVRVMFNNREIINIQNTVAQQVAEFKFRGEDLLAEELSSLFISSFIAEELNVQVNISNATMNSLVYQNEIKSPYNDAQIISSLRRDVIGIRDKEVYGPYTFTINIWI